MEGIVTEIMRFSLKDGPGIRTTVFLKGCNMFCGWCHNPETLTLKPQLMRYPALCIGCGACLGTCRYGALESVGGVIVHVRDKCVSCGACADNCYSGALVMSGVKMIVADVMAEVMQDIDYYRNSGGGVTVSGGEPACQPEFLLELLKAAKAAGIQTAIESNMNADWAVYEEILPYLDLVMLDIKHNDDAEHMRWTGVGNVKLLENVRKITDLKPTIVRVPIIPGVNDNAAVIAGIAVIIKGLKNIECIELLLYNPLGEGKYAALELEYEFRGVKPTSPEEVEVLRFVAQAAGVPVKIG